MSVNDILDEIENLVVDSKHVFLTNKALVDESELVRLVDDLRNELPGQLQRADRIMEDRESIISVARDEATMIIEQAKAQAAKIIDENELVIQAQEKARLIYQQAKAQEQDIMEKTMMSSNELKINVENYANQVFDALIINIGQVLAQVEEAKKELNRRAEEEIKIGE